MAGPTPAVEEEFGMARPFKFNDAIKRLGRKWSHCIQIGLFFSTISILVFSSHLDSFDQHVMVENSTLHVDKFSPSGSENRTGKLDFYCRTGNAWEVFKKQNVSRLAGFLDRSPWHKSRSQRNRVVIWVDKNGKSGAFKTVQAAIDAVKAGNKQRVIIKVRPGLYKEKVIIPESKPFITIEGSGMHNTWIIWHSKADDLGKDGKPLTSYNSASVTVYSDYFHAKNISFKNTSPHPLPGTEGGQAAAFRISGDKASFYGCGFYGAQDTLCDDKGRHYFHSCFIEGSIDFIFGNGLSLYEDCRLHSIATSYGSIAAQNRISPEQNTGFFFLDCCIYGHGPIYLGRAMGHYSRTVYAFCYIADILDPRGWDDWDHDKTRDRTAFFGEYKCFGPGADRSGRVGWSRELNVSDMRKVLSTDLWDY